MLKDRPLARAARGLALAELGEYPAANQEIANAIDEAPRPWPRAPLRGARYGPLGGDEVLSQGASHRAPDIAIGLPSVTGNLTWYFLLPVLVFPGFRAGFHDIIDGVR